jgi:hypothetical protein
MCSVKIEFEFEFDVLLCGSSSSCGKHTITFDHIYEKLKIKSLNLSSSLGKGHYSLRLMIQSYLRAIRRRNRYVLSNEPVLLCKHTITFEHINS